MATENDKVNTGALTTLVLVGLFATLSVALAVTALVRYSVNGVANERQTLVGKEYRRLEKAQSAKLRAAPRWTDKGKGLVSIPIERAKGKVLVELTRDPTSATPPAPEPAPSAAAAGDAAGATSEIQMQDDPTGAAPPAPPKNEHAAVEKPKLAPSAAVAASGASAKTPAPSAAAPAPAAPKAAPSTPTAPAPKPTDG
jgi:hypothetical protein